MPRTDGVCVSYSVCVSRVAYAVCVSRTCPRILRAYPSYVRAAYGWCARPPFSCLNVFTFHRLLWALYLLSFLFVYIFFKKLMQLNVSGMKLLLIYWSARMFQEMVCECAQLLPCGIHIHTKLTHTTHHDAVHFIYLCFSLFCDFFFAYVLAYSTSLLFGGAWQLPTGNCRWPHPPYLLYFGNS